MRLAVSSRAHLPGRSLAATLSLASLSSLAACGGGTSTPTPAPSATASHSSSSSSDTSSDTAAADGGIAVGDIVFSSTLEPPTHDVGLSQGVTQDGNGITLTVDKPNGGYTYTEIPDFHGIPQNIAMRVHVAEAAPASGVYYGIGCRGYGQNSQYLLLADGSGKWAIVQVKDGAQTVLKSGTASGVDATAGVTVDAACVTPASDDKTNHLVLALDGKVVGTVDDSYENVPISNAFELIAISPGQDTGTGSVVFNRLEVRSASSQ